MERTKYIRQKKVALISDLSGLGRCSISVQLPILSVLGIECLLLPTCVLSNHTGYSSWAMQDLTDSMDPFMEEWKKHDVKLDGIVTGFLSSEEQMEKVKHFFKFFKSPSTLVVVDPILGDDGVSYSTCDDKIVRAMQELVKEADVLVPNVTEACLLLKEPYRSDFSFAELEKLAEGLQKMGAKQVVLTGIEKEGKVYNLLLSPEKKSWQSQPKKLDSRAGTGDLFCGVLAGKLIEGYSLEKAVECAAQFVLRSLEASDLCHTEVKEGTAFEVVLKDLLP